MEQTIAEALDSLQQDEWPLEIWPMVVTVGRREALLTACG